MIDGCKFFKKEKRKKMHIAFLKISAEKEKREMGNKKLDKNVKHYFLCGMHFTSV